MPEQPVKYRHCGLREPDGENLSMRNNLLTAAFAAALMAAATPAQAELIGAGRVSVIADIVKAQGMQAEIKKTEGEPDYIESKHDGLKYLILFMNCNDAKRDCKTIQFYMGYNDAKDTPLDKLNSWNRDKRFARAYRDDEGDPVLEMDLDLDFNGIPRENVGEALNTWKALMEAFQTHIHGEGSGS
jgi:Putative bacterial sensory transduction regulator